MATPSAWLRKKPSRCWFLSSAHSSCAVHPQVLLALLSTCLATSLHVRSSLSPSYHHLLCRLLQHHFNCSLCFHSCLLYSHRQRLSYIIKIKNLECVTLLLKIFWWFPISLKKICTANKVPIRSLPMSPTSFGWCIPTLAFFLTHNIPCLFLPPDLCTCSNRCPDSRPPSSSCQHSFLAQMSPPQRCLPWPLHKK